MLTPFRRLLEPKEKGPEIDYLLKVKISIRTLTKENEEHPDYPSLLSISDILNSYEIENIGIQMDRDKFGKISTPFIP